MKKNKRSAFTIVELVIVIAIIAILAAVLIPTFSSLIRTANISSDMQLIKNFNTTLAADEPLGGKPTSMNEAAKVLNDAGYEINKLSPTTEGCFYGWDQAANRFVFIDENFDVAYAEGIASEITVTNVWIGVDAANAVAAANKGYNLYLTSAVTDTLTLTNTVGVDSQGVAAFELDMRGTNTANVILRGAFTTVTINNPNADVTQYGSITTLDIVAVKDGTFVAHGLIKEASLTVGKLEVAKDGAITTLSSVAAGKVVVNNGYIGTVASGITGTVENNGHIETVAGGTVTNNSGAVIATVAGGSVTNNGQVGELEDGATITGTAAIGKENLTSALTLDIGTLAELENFRDQVNAGRDYAGYTINLTADIDLTGKSWKPIGDKKDIAFNGTFDGQNHIITGLSDNGYVGAFYTTSNTFEKGCIYGFFGFTMNATVKNLNFDKVDIDIPEGIHVGVVVGFAGLDSEAASSLNIENCKVLSGKVIGSYNVGGIVGRAYCHDLKVTNCENNATVTAYSGENGGRSDSLAFAGGIIGFISQKEAEPTTSITGCTNKGAVSAKETGNAYAGAMIGGLGNNNEVSTVTGFTNSGEVTAESKGADPVILGDAAVIDNFTSDPKAQVGLYLGRTRSLGTGHSHGSYRGESWTITIGENRVTYGVKTYYTDAKTASTDMNPVTAPNLYDFLVANLTK